jgi:galactose mutarotase-like enzyme
VAGAELERVRLSSPGGDLQATFIPGAGMLCCSLRHEGEELLASGGGVEAYVRLGKTMGIPLLYPWANRLAAFDYRVAGSEVTVPHDPSTVAVDGNGLPIHGVLGARVRWELPPGPGEADSLSARARWDESQPAFAVFPFRHDLDYRARLRDGRLEIEVAAEACGQDAVPVAFGFHPYLTLPGSGRERWQVELPAMRHLELDASQIPTGPGEVLAPERFRLGEREYDDGYDEVSDGAAFAVSGAGRRIELELLGGYPFAQVYAPRGGEFICFEPMTAPANALRSHEGLLVLDPGERHVASFSVSVQRSD